MTITSSREIDAVFRHGRRVATPSIVALIADTPEGRGPSGRVAFIAGKKLGKAVFRNRSKRVMREAVRRAGGPWAGFDVLLLANRSTESRPPAVLDRALADIVEKGGLRT